jgi:DNA transformation protein and related proteins
VRGFGSCSLSETSEPPHPRSLRSLDLSPPLRGDVNDGAASAFQGHRVDHDFIRDLFASFGPVTVRRMFSGAGIFADGLMFGLVIRDVIYLKVDEGNRPDFEREGCAPFTYTRGKKSGRPSQRALPYWRLPERLYDDPDELALWARRALAAAARKKFAPRWPAKRKQSDSPRQRLL